MRISTNRLNFINFSHVIKIGITIYSGLNWTMKFEKVARSSLYAMPRRFWYRKVLYVVTYSIALDMLFNKIVIARKFEKHTACKLRVCRVYEEIIVMIIYGFVVTIWFDEFVRNSWCHRHMISNYETPRIIQNSIDINQSDHICHG